MTSPQARATAKRLCNQRHILRQKAGRPRAPPLFSVHFAPA